MRLPQFTAALALAAACITDPVSVAAPTLALSDGSSGGNSHFFFLPPMVPSAPAGTNDATLSPRVVICEWDGAACVTTLATYTMDLATTTTTQAGNSETVRLGAGHFIVNWHTEFFPLDPTRTYRVCVRAGEFELGYADVDVAASGRELRVGTEEYVSVLDGRTLPIVFRIEPGALEEGTGSCGGGTGPE